MKQQRIIGIILVCFGLVLLLILGFVKADLDKQGAFLCEMVEESPDMTMSECPAHQSNSSWLISLGFGMAFLVAGVGLYFIFAPTLKPQKPRAKRPIINLEKLDAEEKAIMTFLQASEGSVYQSDLVRNTEFSKVKVTRILDRLETKGFLERKRRGMANLVVIK